jgi:serine/threonine protein kinase
MVCYEILTGRVPFFNFKLMGIRKSIKDGLRPNMPEQCPEQLSTLVQACYHCDPKARPSFPDICVELRHIMCSLMVDSTS